MIPSLSSSQISISSTVFAVGVSKIVTKVSKVWVSVAVVIVRLAEYSPALAYTCVGFKSVDVSESPKSHIKLTTVSEVNNENSVPDPAHSFR